MADTETARLRPPRRFSLRRRVGWWLVLPLGLLVLINAALSYRGALDAANHAYDRSLTASLDAIAENTHATGGRILVDVPHSAFDIFEEGTQERVFYAVVAPDGSRLTGYADLPVPPGEIGTDRPTVMDTHYRGEAIRLGALGKRLYDPELQGGDMVTILFAETTEDRAGLALDLFFDNLRGQGLLIAAGAILVLFTLTRAFRPLMELRERVRGRDEEDLTPIQGEHIPSELLPLIEAINHHMQRLAQMLEARRRFLADAAHQIRTPLALMNTQAEYGLRQEEAGEMRKTFAGLLASIRAARRMANQMLTLSRAEPANGLIQEREPLDLVELVREVAADLAPLAVKKEIDLGFEGPVEPIAMKGNRAMLREMLTNLADNAIRYTPARGQVSLSIGRRDNHDHRAVIRVVDDGPGIPPSERVKVFQRFYRILGQADSEGSGLGLPIVREICHAHGGDVRLLDNAQGRGLCAELTLPVVD